MTIMVMSIVHVNCMHWYEILKATRTQILLRSCCWHFNRRWPVERSSSVVECRTRNRESPGSNPPLLPFRRLGIFRSLHWRPCSLSCINEYLAIDSGGNVSDLVLARNCCLARMLPREAENGVGMNRSVREGKKCEALWAVQRTGYCAI